MDARETQTNALRTLYVATGGASWANRLSWLGAEPACQWHGVGCDDRGAVSSLRLPANVLSGTVPPEVGDLASLGVLFLPRNSKLAGTAPSQLGKLSALTFLALDSNRLSGTIPGCSC